MAKYPAQIDTTSSLPTVVDNVTPIDGKLINRLRDAILSIESELGVKPSGLYSTVRARLDAIENKQTSGGFSAGKDLSGDGTFQTVIGFQGRPVNSTAPLTGQAYLWNGTAWAPGSIVPFTAELSGGGIVEVSQTVATPSFTAVYSATPTSAILSDSNAHTQDVTSTPSSFNSNYTFVENNFGLSVTFTLTATYGVEVKTPTATLSWGQKLYWGLGPAGLAGNNFITYYSTGNNLTLTRATTFAVNAGETQKIYFACRSGYGSGTALFTVGGFDGGFTFKGTFSHTNGFGFTELYDLYESDNIGLGSTTVTVL